MDGGFALAEDSLGRLKVRRKAERHPRGLARGVKKLWVKLSLGKEGTDAVRTSGLHLGWFEVQGLQ